MNATTFHAIWISTGEEFICWQAARGSIGFQRPDEKGPAFRSLPEDQFWRFFSRPDGSKKPPESVVVQEPQQSSLFG